jgi:methylamine dehydrogenase accessory protein MauD
MDLLIISNIILWIVLVAMACIIYALVRQIGILYERVAPAGALALNRKLAAGMEAPAMTVTTVNKQNLIIGSLPADGRAKLLFFLAPDCPVCKTLLPALKSAAKNESGWLDVILASDGEELDHRRFVEEYSLQQFHYVISELLGINYGISKLPYGVLIDETGRIAALGIINSREHLDSLFEAKERKVASIQDYVRRHKPNSKPERSVDHELAG